jgi:hypothetical protein
VRWAVPHGGSIFEKDASSAVRFFQEPKCVSASKARAVALEISLCERRLRLEVISKPLTQAILSACRAPNMENAVRCVANHVYAVCVGGGKPFPSRRERDERLAMETY